MPNDYGSARRAFTKLMKPPFSFLRSEGYLSAIYIGDCYLQGNSFIKSLQQEKGNFEAKITLLYLSKKELAWWEINVMTAIKILKKLPVDTTIYTDASLDR